jgi:hypothetical protein
MKPTDFWLGWMNGWAAATKAMLEGQQEALQHFGRSRQSGGAGAMPLLPLNLMQDTFRASLPQNMAHEMAGSRPSRSPRPRGRPRTSAAAPGTGEKRRRGRPPKAKPAE